MTCPQSIAWWTPDGPKVAQQICQRKGTSSSFFVVVVCLVLFFVHRKTPVGGLRDHYLDLLVHGDRVGSSSFKSIKLQLSFFQIRMEHTEIFALYHWEALKKNTVDEGVTFKKSLQLQMQSGASSGHIMDQWRRLMICSQGQNVLNPLSKCVLYWSCLWVPINILIFHLVAFIC